MVKKIETKTYRGKMDFKGDGKDGQFSAVFATLNVIDHDDDVTLPGAFDVQDVLIEPWNHGWDLPVGKGSIHEDGEEAIVDGKFFMDIPEAKNHYIVAKELSEKQEWSYTFRIIESKRGEYQGQEVRFLEKMEVIGVSQVSKGAGINTRTTDIKSALKDLMKSADDEEDPASNGADNPVSQGAGDNPAGGDDPAGKTESEDGDSVNESGASPEDAQTYFELLARS